MPAGSFAKPRIMSLSSRFFTVSRRLGAASGLVLPPSDTDGKEEEGNAGSPTPLSASCENGTPLCSAFFERADHIEAAPARIHNP